MSVLMFVALEAHAGEIQVLTRTPVMVVVDGKILEYPEGSTTVTATDLAGGSHEVQVKSLLGKLVTSTTVEVPADQQVRFEYANKTLTATGSGALPARPTVVVVSAPASGRALSSDAYSELLGQLQSSSFDHDRQERVAAAAGTGWFTCAQIAGLLRTFQFDAERLRAAEVLAPRAVDAQNASVVADVFEFSMNGKKAVALFSS